MSEEKMSRTFPEIIDLFTKVSLHLDSRASTSVLDEDSIDYSVSNLSRSLNPNVESSGSRCRVLDTAVSLMCFKAPQVFDFSVEYAVRTIACILSSSVQSKVLKVREKEILQVGGSISRFDCVQLLVACGDLFENLEGRGIPSFNLLYAIIRALASAGCFPHSTPLKTAHDPKPTGLDPMVTRLTFRIPEDLLLDRRGLQFRLYTWYLDPLMLKRDVLKIMHEVKDRPFLCLSEEFHQRKEWRAIITCLVLSPAMLTQTRSLLHRWFLASGLASVLHLQTHLLSTVVDVISRPSWWGISMDVSSNLPFLHAYFPCSAHVVRLLAGPLSLENLTSLANIMLNKLSHSKSHVDPVIKRSSMAAAVCLHSTWDLAINFPDWSLFASCLLFCHQRSQCLYQPKGALSMALHDQFQILGPTQSSTLAASYISWILCPGNESNCKILNDWLIEISGSWDEQLKEQNHNTEKKKHKKCLTLNAHENDYNIPRTNIVQWLRELHDVSIESLGFCLTRSSLYCSIPLGILLVYLDCLKDDVCELLLHYAATSQILLSTDSPHSRRKSVDCGLGREKKGAIAGLFLVFSLTDAVESMSSSVFDTEEEVRDFICLVKEKVKKYLVKCVEVLIRAELDRDLTIQSLQDLPSRYLRWKKQGDDLVVEGMDRDDVITALEHKVTTYRKGVV